MDNNYENIVPWNGANDTGRDVRLKLQRNFSKIGINFQELEGKFTTVDELFDLIEQELEKKLSKTENEWAAGIITFLKGLIAEELIQANNGLVVRKTEVVEPMLMSLLSEEFEEGIVELFLKAVDLVCRKTGTVSDCRHTCPVLSHHRPSLRVERIQFLCQ